MLKSANLYMLFPNRMGLLKDQRPLKNLKNQNFTMGDYKANMLSHGMKSMKNIEKINMSNNNLTNKGASNIIDSIGIHTKSIDFSYNKLAKNPLPFSQNFCDLLALKITDQKYNLREINLQGNSLGDSKIMILLQSCISQHNTVYKLNLNNNNLTNKISENLK